MPYAAGSECQHGSNSLVPLKSSSSHEYPGDCGGRLHGACDHRDASSDNKMHHLCYTCFEKSGHDGPSSDGKGNDLDGGPFKTKWP